jgi:DNA repair exonuclease SbcCD nuclease subunit
MLAHEWEVGHNFDLKIASQEILSAFSILFDEAIETERCVINDLGDFTHYENFAAVTEASRHPLDADGRFTKLIHVYSAIMRNIVDKALTKQKYVDVIINQGNHSRTNDIWMAELLRVAYGESGRVNVLNNGSVFIPYRMGNTFVMTHHSDKTKPEKLLSVMANDFRQEWGETEYHYVDIGHYHHKMAIIERGGAKVEMWNTLAPMDKYAHDYGYRSHQSITRVDRSRTYGEVGRRVLSIREIRDKLNKCFIQSDYVAPNRRAVFTA